MSADTAAQPCRLEARDVACWRGGRMLFRGLSFSLDAGGAILLTGRNGTGKTSLLRLIAGLAQPAEGELLFNGESVADDPEAFRARLSYLGHLNALKPAESVRTNITFWSSLRGQDGTKASAALDRMGIANLTDTPVRLLSAGQRRRTALARIASQGAALWLLDEPATGLDIASRARLGDMIAAHRQDGGMLIVAAHGDLEPPGAIECNLDRLVV